MPLPPKISTSLLSALQEEEVLSLKLAKKVVASLEANKPVNWNLVLEKKIADELFLKGGSQ